MAKKVDLMNNENFEIAYEIQEFLAILLLGLRTMGAAVKLLAIQDDAFKFRVKNDLVYREQVEAMLKALVTQKTVNAQKLDVVQRVHNKMQSALEACDDWSIDMALERPVDMEKLPLLDRIDINYVNDLNLELYE